MKPERKAGLFVALVFISIMGGIGYTILNGQMILKAWENRVSTFKLDISRVYVLKEGIVESPSVIILLDSEFAFWNKVSELEVATIYYEMLGSRANFYVFGEEDNMLVAYRFQIYAWD